MTAIQSYKQRARVCRTALGPKGAGDGMEIWK